MNETVPQLQSTTSTQQSLIIIDDDIDFAESLAEILHTQGYRIFTASSARHALEIIREHNPRCALIDIRLGQENGAELATILQKKFDISCIVMTAYSEIDSAVAALKAGVRDYLRKPIDPTELIHSVGRTLAMVRLEDDRNAALMALQKSEERYALALRSIDAGVWDWNIKENIFFTSPRWKEMFGANDLPHRSIFENWKSRILPEHRRAVSLYLKNIRETRQEKIHIEYKMLNNSNRYIWVSEYATAIYDKDGDLTRITGSSRDITVQKELEEQLLQSQKMQAIGQLAGGIAHDFNNLLTGILGYASLLKLDYQNDSKVLQPAEVIEKAALRAMDLTRQLLGFARKGKNRSLNVNPSAIVLEVLKLSERTIEGSISIDLNLSQETLSIKGDPTQLQQVVLNLILNARDAVKDRIPGKITISVMSDRIENEDQIMLTGLPMGSYVVIEVADNGLGMDAEVAKRVFEPFFTTKKQGEGLGMGLAMVYGIVTNHGGTVLVNSIKNTGTSFKAYFPQIEPPASTLQPLDTTVRSSEHLKEKRGLVMIIDDDPLLLTTTRHMLLRMGYQVACFSMAKEALNYFRNNHQDVQLVILDLVMPDISAVSCYQQLSNIDPNVCVVLSTGYGLNEQAQSALNMGIKSLIEKPYSYGELEAALSDLPHLEDRDK
ncbi:MAG: response regulator [bacterium]|nr:response regulator [bacterium]